MPCGVHGRQQAGSSLAAGCLTFCSGSCPLGAWCPTLCVFLLKSPTLTSPHSLSKPEIFTGPELKHVHLNEND